MKDNKPCVIELELPTGIRLSMCRFCGGSTFIVDMQTDHKVTVVQGRITVTKPRLAKDVIKRRLKPENITCARCFRKEAQ